MRRRQAEPESLPVTDRVRAAAVQFATGTDLEENLAACLRMLDAAAAEGADLVVMPEFCNHLSVYEDEEHCRSVAVALDGPWLGALAQRSAEHGVHASFPVTVPRSGDRVTATNVLVNAHGEIAATADKQMLMGNERAHLSAGAEVSPLADTAFGPTGLYSCMDGVTFEVPRTFAVRGARLLLNSLNSFALDEARLHIPVRAVENGVFVVAANKVGPLLPADRVADFSKALGVPAEALSGAGESQIVAPDGTVLAKAPRRGEAVAVADLDLSRTEPDRLRGRRPELYGPLARPHTARPGPDVDTEVTAACVPGARSQPGLVQGAIDAGARLVVLPELAAPPQDIPPGVLVVTTALRDGQHLGRVWSAQGVVHEQAQIHSCSRYPDATRLGAEMRLYPTPFGDLAVIVGDDHRFPETFRLAAIAGAHLAAVCWAPTSRWECDLALFERAAENRICVAACGPPGPLAATMLLDPPADSLWNPSRSGPFDGTINTPICQRAEPEGELLIGALHPGRAANREVSKNTDVVGGRPWQAAAALTAPPTPQVSEG